MAHRSIIDLIGNTPLLRLNGLSERTGCEILGKAEFLNPGGSVKDRAALNIIREAEADGSLRPGGTIVEGTAGNTGIGLALVGGADVKRLPSASTCFNMLKLPNYRRLSTLERSVAYAAESRAGFELS